MAQTLYVRGCGGSLCFVGKQEPRVSIRGFGLRSVFRSREGGAALTKMARADNTAAIVNGFRIVDPPCGLSLVRGRKEKTAPQDKKIHHLLFPARPCGPEGRNPSFGSPAIRLGLTRGSAAPSHDEFAFVGKGGWMTYKLEFH